MWCGYADREETIASFLYDELESPRRTDFEAHLLICTLCRDEVAGLRAVRAGLDTWQPPAIVRRAAAVDHPAGWRAIPAWAQVAAALLVLGVSAGFANLRVHYDSSGLTIQTGWSQTSRAAVADGQAAAAPWRAELAALEQRMRNDFRAQQTSASAIAASTAPQRVQSSTDADTMRRMHALVDESEKRQQRELALRVAEVLRDVSAQRRADLINIDRNLDQMQNNLGVQVLRQGQSLNYLMRVNQRQ
jgi:anti-sigma factor ChrR (cupin superfamily)